MHRVYEQASSSDTNLTPKQNTFRTRRISSKMMSITSAQAFPILRKSPKSDSVSVNSGNPRRIVGRPTLGHGQSNKDCHTHQNRIYRTSGSACKDCLSIRYRPPFHRRSDVMYLTRNCTSNVIHRTLSAVLNSISDTGEIILPPTITVVDPLYWIIRLQWERTISPRDYEIKRRRPLNNPPAHFQGPMDRKVFFTRVGDAGRLKASFPGLGVKLNNTRRQEERHMERKKGRAE